MIDLKTIPPLHSVDQQKAIELLQSDIKGLSEDEVKRRLENYGYNELPDAYRTPRWQILIGQFKSAIVLLLVVAAIISYFFGDLVESIAIVLVILLNGAIGYILESQAIRSMQALRKLDKSHSRVLRNGKTIVVESKDLVPGDMIQLEAGDLIPADGRIVESQRFEVNEASLTGESVPVEKDASLKLDEKTSLADRRNMVYKGTAATRGNGIVVVGATGIRTEIGKISEMVESAQKDEIPLNAKLDRFGKKLIWITLGLIVIFFITRLIRGNKLYVILETAIALAVAAIPEGLPIVATISLAKGMLELSRKKVIIKKIAAVETLGETDIIITDKTGTLTENQLKVSEIVPVNDEYQPRMDRAAVLCNNARKTDEGIWVGDPVEIALKESVSESSPDEFASFMNEWNEVEELPFDSEFMYMANLYRNEGRFITVAKGSTQVILETCNRLGGKPLAQDDVKEWIQKTDQLAEQGLKVLAFADREWDNQPDEWAQGLNFLGLVGFLDPPRPDVSDAIADCRNAGIRVIMATGDHPATARKIADEVGLTGDDNGSRVLHGAEMEELGDEAWQKAVQETSILSRVTPRQKLRVVEFYQSKGHIVGMTGDGVNDAPALKKSDIGIAMGLRGTQVAEEAADMVLQDDAFTSIVHAIRQGRIIFDNIRNFIIYLLSCNLTEIMVVSIAAFMSSTLPLLPLQILFLNLVTDVFPALALGMGKGSPRVMKHRSRNPKDPILNRRNWRAILIYASVMTLTILGGYYYVSHFLHYNEQQANTVAFLALALAQLTHPFNLATRHESFFKNPISRNRYLWGAIILCIALLVLALVIPAVRDVLELMVPTGEAWLVIAIASILPLGIIRIIKMIGNGKS